jgi:thiol-disulfide isomerase/thioredoxin
VNTLQIDLPSDFLSTPFGAALRPTIDAMFRPQGAGQAPDSRAIQQATQASPNPALAASLLQSVASAATQPSGAVPPPATAASTVSAPMQICTNDASFASLLSRHRVVIGFFTSATCPPCRMIEPVFERIAEEKTQGRMGSSLPAFVKVSIDTPSTRPLANKYNVRATPTFIFFLDGKQVKEFVN